MSFFQKILSFFQPPSLPKDYAHYFTVRCSKCGEEIRGRVNLANDLTIEYGAGNAVSYHCRKVLIGEQLCFQKIEVMLRFDGKKKLVESEISGGTFVDQ